MSSPTGPDVDLSGKVAVITTLGTDAVGEEIIAQLLLSNVAKLYVLARAPEEYAAILDELSVRQGLSSDAPGVEFVPCDLASIRSTADAAKVVLQKTQQLQRIDLLFCHASSPASAPTTNYEAGLSPDGVDVAFATGYLGHFVLVNILLPLLEQTATAHQQARVVVSTSYLQAIARDAAVDSFTSTPGEGPSISPASGALSGYARSQLAKTLFTRYLAKLESDGKGYPIYANCFDATDIQPDLLGDAAASLPPAIFRKNGQDPEAAAATAMYLAASSDIAENQYGGQYFGSVAARGQLHDAAADKDLMNNLWYWSDHKVSEVLGRGWQDVGAASSESAPDAPQ